jgi:hypothetical protein
MLVWKLSLPSPAAVHPHRICYRGQSQLGQSTEVIEDCLALATQNQGGIVDLPVFLPHMGCFRSSSFFAPAAGVSPVKRGEAQRSRERSDLDAPAAGYTVARERALARSRRPLRSLPRSFILTLRISFGVSDPKREPVLRMQPCRPHHLTSGRASSARTIIPHARGRRARVGGDHPVKRHVSAREKPRSPPARIRRSRRVQLRWNGFKPLSYRLECRTGLSHRGHAALSTAPSGTTP